MEPPTHWPRLATQLLESGYDIRTVQKLVGHADVCHDVDQEKELIKLEAVGYKKGGQLFIRGKEYKL